MPELCRFFGIVISINYDAHSPPHFHAEYNEYDAPISIATGLPLEGYLPPKQLKFVKRWYDLNKLELIAVWDTAKQQKPVAKMNPLEK